MNKQIAFIGGGNMASAIIGGLLRQGMKASNIRVVEPWDPAQAKLRQDFGLEAQSAPDASLAQAGLVVWAVKPQVFKDVARSTQAHTTHALHLSVAAGIRSDSLALWLGSERIIRSMPNTPALIGKGITALYARAAVSPADRQWAQEVIASTGQFLWLEREEQLDAVTAISGSGPAYLFFLMEAMRQTGSELGLPAEQAYQLAVATFIGAGELARASSDPPEVLRQRVTSKGGTTFAAISVMESTGMKERFAEAMQAAYRRAKEMGDEFGGQEHV